MILARISERLGLVPRRKGRGVIVWVSHPKSYGRVASLIAELAVLNPRVNFFLVSEDRTLSEHGSLPQGISQVLAMPISTGLFFSLFLARTRPQAILLVSSNEHSHGTLLQAAQGRGVPVLWSTGAISSLKDSLQSCIVDESRKYAGGAGRLLRAPIIRGLSERRFGEISSVEALSEKLAYPRRILCLGNGPSSESTELRSRNEGEFDAIFRVNHRWLERGLFARPHMVFTAGSKPVRRITSPTIFCAQNRLRAERIRLACLHLAGARQLVVAEDLDLFEHWDALEALGFGPFAPTNGAVMLAVAEALRPERITLAGIDFFSDPQGAYPGDARTPNAYGIFHNAAKEREYTLRWIERHMESGVTLDLIGSALQEAWRERRP